MADANRDPALDGRLLLAFLGDDLAACASHGRLKHPGTETPLRRALEFDGAVRVLQALAVSCTHRGQAGAMADQAMHGALLDIFERESGAPTVVIARIDRRNSPSERCAARNNFELIDDLPEPDQLRNWFTLLEEEQDA